MSLNTTEATYITVGLLDFGGVLIWWCISAHLAYTKLEIILHHLKNCDVGSHRLFYIWKIPWKDMDIELCDIRTHFTQLSH
jgi:hypothetical protein